MKPLRPTDSSDYTPSPVQGKCDKCGQDVESWGISWRHASSDWYDHDATVRGCFEPRLDRVYQRSLRSPV